MSTVISQEILNTRTESDEREEHDLRPYIIDYCCTEPFGDAPQPSSSEKRVAGNHDESTVKRQSCVGFGGWV